MYFGARISSRAPDGIIRPILVAVLLLSSIKLLGASDDVVLGLFVVAVIVGAVLGALALRRQKARRVTVNVPSHPIS